MKNKFNLLFAIFLILCFTLMFFLDLYAEGALSHTSIEVIVLALGGFLLIQGFALLLHIVHGRGKRK